MQYIITWSVRNIGRSVFIVFICWNFSSTVFITGQVRVHQKLFSSEARFYITDKTLLHKYSIYPLLQKKYSKQYR